jgi:hypothetical protein
MPVLNRIRQNFTMLCFLNHQKHYARATHRPTDGFGRPKKCIGYQMTQEYATTTAEHEVFTINWCAAQPALDARQNTISQRFPPAITWRICAPKAVRAISAKWESQRCCSYRNPS